MASKVWRFLFFHPEGFVNHHAYSSQVILKFYKTSRKSPYIIVLIDVMDCLLLVVFV